MNFADICAIIIVILFLISPGVMAYMMVYSNFKDRTMKQKRIHKFCKRELRETTWFFVNYFKKPGLNFRGLFPWDNSGILKIEDKKVTLISENPDGKIFSQPFEQGHSQASWFGRDYFNLGRSSWFVIVCDNEMYYFTREKGMKLYNPAEKTREVFNEISGSLNP
jgi:hypothetical protein